MTDLTAAELQIAHDVFEKINTPKSLAAAILLREGEYAQLVSLKFDPSINGPDDYLVINLLKKYPFKHPDLNPERAAVESFLAAEERCRLTNMRLRGELSSFQPLYQVRDKIIRCHGPVCKIPHDLFNTAFEIISTILGSREPTMRELMSSCRFGTKAATGNSGRNAHLLAHVNNVTYWEGKPGVAALYQQWNAGSGKDATFVPVAAGITSFVDKNATTKRSVGPQPAAQMYFQLGIDGMLRSRLRRVGIDLSSQRNNQKLALEASRTGRFATIDLQAASDTLAYELVTRLLPGPWVKLLLAFRVPYTDLIVDGKKRTLTLEKFSGMGNGYTFSLQTLIYYGLARAAMTLAGYRGKILVYGDDIIVPTEAYGEVCNALIDAGLVVNPDKSYSQGPFRESCGMYAWNGQILRPFRFTEPCQHPRHWIRFANALFAHAAEEGGWGLLSPRWRDVYRKVVRHANTSLAVLNAKRRIRAEAKGRDYKPVVMPTIPPNKLDRESLFKFDIIENALYDARAPRGSGKGWCGVFAHIVVWENGVTFWEFDAPDDETQARGSPADRSASRREAPKRSQQSRKPGGRYLRLTDGDKAVRLATYTLSHRVDSPGPRDESRVDAQNRRSCAPLLSDAGGGVEMYSTRTRVQPRKSRVFIPTWALADGFWG